MRTIDRYLLTQFMQVFLICFVSLTGLYVVIDAFGNLDDFIEFADRDGGLAVVVGRYYGFRSIAFFDRISGLLTLISAMFTVTWLQRHREMIALSAAGISTTRILAPILVAAIGLSLLAAANRELVLPRLKHVLSLNAQDLAGTRKVDVRPQYDHRTNILIRGKSLYAKDCKITEPAFRLPESLAQYGTNLAAQKAFWCERTNNRPSGYLLKQVSAPEGLVSGPSLSADGSPVILTPSDHEWLQDDEVFVVSDITFDMLHGGSGWKSFSSTWEMIAGLHNPSLDFGADMSVAVHGRLVQPFLDVTLVFLGLPLVISRGGENMFWAIGQCILIAVLFLVVVFACQALGSSYWLDPALAVWLPLFLFVPLAVWMSEPLRR
ncbi:MAG: LptF/LptG family permease [Planctomycetales bacterium]|nr:LptF/LptG family permease [Planctomycetales bacterium]